ncbi:two-component sensor histidine kinase [Companilactobacillus sp. RD055328]|uniref:HAMP domain-containing sensor histidine kinase n=1 Tax=Companilactobacillus sp. RD055328 TaxID=2916634 RepID=UPI001FC8A639|nr:HAMP domain-containing histidine kinase [Companilactobacillus sp. RD055328]GKQ42523.1 two-component sensor histidine kinase [Companilactobacillus sp. RD055328]
MEKERKKKGPRISLRFKWTFFITTVVFFIYVVFSTTVLYFVSSSMLKNEVNTIKNAVSAVSSRFEDSEQLLSKRIVNDKVEGLSDAGYQDTLVEQLKRSNLQVLLTDINNQTLYKTQDIKIDSKKTDSLKITKLYKNSNIDSLAGSAPIKSTKTGEIIGYVTVNNKMSEYHRTIRELYYELIPNAVFILILSAVSGFIFASFVLRRLKLINNTIKDINESPDSDARIPHQSQNDEITDVAEQFNEMLDRMQQYANQQKEFVQDVSHELRTPVAVVEGHLKLLNRWGKDDPEILDESLSSSLQEINRMKNLIQEMLDLTRIEQPDNQFSNEITEVKPMIKQIYNDFKVLHPEFIMNFDDDIRGEAWVKIYRNHLEQIIIILLDNAIKYSKDRKEVNLAISRNENYLEVAIQDFGVGISADDQDKIFNRFYRADKDRSRQSGGNGLGLPIARQLVKNYQGFMYVESVVGSGSVFRIELPLQNKKD